METVVKSYHMMYRYNMNVVERMESGYGSIPDDEDEKDDDIYLDNVSPLDLGSSYHKLRRASSLMYVNVYICSYLSGC